MYRAEYSKSVTICDRCDEIISENELCLGKSVQSSFNAVLSPWFHFTCFFDRSKSKSRPLPKRVEEIEQFDALNETDRERIRKTIDEHNELIKATESSSLYKFQMKQRKLKEAAEKIRQAAADEGENRTIVPISKLELILKPLIAAIFEAKHLPVAGPKPHLMPRVISIPEYKLDLEKMPWGRLVHPHILEASQVLGEALDMLDQLDNLMDVPKEKIDEMLSRFLMLITTNFGSEFPAVLDTSELQKCKLNSLKYLLDSQLGYLLLLRVDFTLDRQQVPSPLDRQYLSLQCNITSVDKDSDTWNILEKYFNKTKPVQGTIKSGCSTGGPFLELVNIFTLERYDEDKRFEKFKNLHNRKLLWHGTSMHNFVGILSQGLRIAMAKGGLYGKGIYFSDTCSKAINYCRHRTDFTLLLLCEVALGDEDNASKMHSEGPSEGKHSVKSTRGTNPDPTDFVTLPCGAVVPFGKTEKLPPNFVPPHNEYIVYNEAQVTLRYLVQIKQPSLRNVIQL